MKEQVSLHVVTCGGHYLELDFVLSFNSNNTIVLG